MEFFLPLIVVLGLQWVLQFILYNVFMLNFIWVDIIINLVLALVFSLFRFNGQEKWTNPEFHKSIAIYFVILTIMSIIMYFI